MVVTGAASGVGRAVAERFGALGEDLVLVDHDEQALATAASLLGAVTHVVDLRRPDQIDCMVAATTRVDVVVNAAGAWTRAPFGKTVPDQWDAEMGTNLVGPMRLLHGLLPLLLRSPAGRVVNVVSDAARSGEPGVAVYAAAKAGLAAFSRCLALEVAGAGVTVSCVSLSAVDTPGLAASFTPEERSRLPRRYPLGRLGRPEDVVAAVEYLTGPGASWVTGQTIAVNGGYLMT